MILPLLCLGGAGVIIYFWYCQYGPRIRKLRKLPGPKSWPIIGNALDVFVSPDKVFDLLREWKLQYGDIVRIWSLHIHVVCINSPGDAEKLLSTTRFNEKRTPYNFISSWLCQGLLVSNGEKWQHRRKMLTPAFHFDILKQFMKTFVEQTNSMVAKLELEVGKERTNPVDLVTQTTLNVMCETAMGTPIQNGLEIKIKDYLKSIHTFGECLVYRMTRIWNYFDLLYFFNPNKQKRDKAIVKLHKFTEEIIDERRIYRQQYGFNDLKSTNNFCDIYGKKRMAMLDLLLENESKGQIDKLGIREEVDTFMFKGHDTTAMAVSLFLFRIAIEQEVQAEIYAEMRKIFNDDDRDPTVRDLADMKYLELCIKESLRLYPSVPLIARHLHEDVQLSGYTVPAGSICNINIFDIHRREDIYEKPEKFIPERFLPENINKRHRYAYIPFSAGPRNCIGQRFAMMEMKTVISGVLRRFKLEPVTKLEEVKFTTDIVLRTRSPYYIRVVRRD